MEYEVYSVRSMELQDVADEIAGIYELVANRCGRIVAGHTVACDIHTTGGSGSGGENHREDMLFLVAEFPESE